MITVSLDELRSAGISISAEAAVAIAQQLIHGGSGAAAEAPFGPPTMDGVRLSLDGTVRTVHSATTPAVSEMAILLDAMLEGGAVVPGGLRYAIARALHDVDAPPFDSVQSFSDTLARFEHPSTDRVALVRELVERYEMIQVTTVPPVVVERRRSAPPSDQLRRHLREADARLFQQRAGRPRRLIPSPAARTRMLPAAACLACGLALIGSGELMHRHSVQQQQRDPLPVAREADPLPSPDALPAIRSAVHVESARAGETVARRPVRTARRVDVKPVRAVTDGARSTRRSQQKGLLERMRLQWLKHAFTVKSDLD